jgi:hypothetical protein
MNKRSKYRKVDPLVRESLKALLLSKEKERV